MEEEFYVITIGRQYGSGGLSVANCLSQKLSIKAYDSDLLTIAAKQSGISEDTFTKNDEKRKRRFFTGLLNSFWSFGTASFDNDNPMVPDHLFRLQSKVIEQISLTQSAIFVGRCSDYILRDKKRIFNVFLTADMPSRIERISARVGLSPEESEKLIRQTDISRSNYYNYYTLKKWGAAESYDLCINTSKLSVEKASDYIISAAKEYLKF